MIIAYTIPSKGNIHSLDNKNIFITNYYINLH